MIRLGIRPDDEFFLAIKILAAMNKSLEDVVRDVAAAIEALRADSRETVNVMIGGMQAVFDKSHEQIRVTFHGGDGVVGILELIRQAKEETISAAAGLHVAADKMETAATTVEGMVGRVYSREVKSFWFLAAAFGLMFSMPMAVIIAANGYRLDRLIATRNAPEVVRAYAEAFAHHPLPSNIAQDSLDWLDLDGPYQRGIGQMPPQLAYVLSAALVQQDFGSPSEFNALRKEIENLKRRVADMAGVKVVELSDGTRAVRIAEGDPHTFLLDRYEGVYSRVYSSPQK
jgi:hypothetical protein